MYIGKYQLFVEDKILTIKPPGIQLSIQYVKDALGVDESFVFKSMFMDINYEILSKELVEDYAVFQYVKSKDDMVKILFKSDMTHRAWVNGKNVSKGKYSSSEINSIIDGVLSIYETKKPIANPKYISIENFESVPESLLDFQPTLFEFKKVSKTFHTLIYESYVFGKPNTKLIVSFMGKKIYFEQVVGGVIIADWFMDETSNTLLLVELEEYVEDFNKKLQTIIKTSTKKDKSIVGGVVAEDNVEAVLKNIKDTPADKITLIDIIKLCEKYTTKDIPIFCLKKYLAMLHIALLNIQNAKKTDH